MYDTVSAYFGVTSPINMQIFTGYSTVHKAAGSYRRWWIESKQVRLVYWQDAQRLTIEFSIGKLLGGLLNPTDADKERVLDGINEWLRSVGVRADDVRTWKVTRVDYAWNWQVEDVAAYMALLDDLQIGVLKRYTYDNAEGVLFKSKGRHGRWVKFYDKGKQIGLPDVRVLRYEVSNMRRASTTLAETAFGCDQTVDQMLQVGRAVYVLALMWEKAGLDAQDWHSEYDIMSKMRQRYGVSAGIAYLTWCAVRKYGAAARDILTEHQWIVWRKRLRDDGLMVLDETKGGVLVPLSLPIDVALDAAAAAQNLEPLGAFQITPPKKNLWKNVAAGLNLLPSSRPVEALQRAWDARFIP